jgi:hypothetical protein
LLPFTCSDANFVASIIDMRSRLSVHVACVDNGPTIEGANTGEEATDEVVLGNVDGLFHRVDAMV